MPSVVVEEDAFFSKTAQKQTQVVSFFPSFSYKRKSNGRLPSIATIECKNVKDMF
jgi:hypothetical protein